jgi:hypothetical protein
MSSRVPPAAIALAGVQLDRFRASELYAKLPAAATKFLEPFRDAHSLFIVSTGDELLTIARGSMPGATQVAHDVALAGSPALVAAATAPHAPAAILGAAGTVARDHPVWIAVRGGKLLPLQGNLANVNNLVPITEYVTLAARFRDTVDLELTARCPSPGAALQFEQRLRALLSLTAAANARQPAVADMLHSVQLRRDLETVRATLSAAPDALARLLP